MFELTNHLGNVLTTLSDIKLTADANADGNVDGFVADITSAQDYYPGGSLQPGRNWNSDKYAFGFNGKLNDNEIKGVGNSIDFGARIYDSRLGRWMSTDPLQAKYPDLSPYAFCADNPIFWIDFDGRDIHITITDEIVGYAEIRVINSEYVEGAPKTMFIPLYGMTVTDDATGKTSNYLVSRDGPIVAGENGDGNFEIQNSTFEPSDGNTKFSVVPLSYPHGTDLEALALRTPSGSPDLPAEENPYAPRDKSTVANGVMIHVGGQYSTDDGTIRVTGSLGCFGIFSNDKTSLSNSTVKAFFNDLSKRKEANIEAKTGTAIDVTIEKRDVVPLSGTVDEKGNYISVEEAQE